MNGYEKRLEQYEKELKLFVEEHYRNNHRIVDQSSINKTKKENFYLK